MLQLSPPHWNLVAKQSTKSRFGAFMRITSLEELNQAHDREYKLLRKQGYPVLVANLFLELAPLLCEREAIAKAKRQNWVIQQALPEVTSVKEAVQIATRQDYLTPRQVKQLWALLEREEKVTKQVQQQIEDALSNIAEILGKNRRKNVS